MKRRSPEAWLALAAAKPKASRPIFCHVHEGRLATDGTRLHLIQGKAPTPCDCENYPNIDFLIEDCAKQATRVTTTAEHLASLARVAAKVTGKPYHNLILEANGDLIARYHNDDLDGTCTIHNGDYWPIGPVRYGIPANLQTIYRKEGPDAEVHVNARLLQDALSVMEGAITLALGPSHVYISCGEYVAMIAQVDLKRSH